MAARWDKQVQAEREDLGDRNFERSRIKIEVESLEDMEINQDKGSRSKTFEKGQSSKDGK